jgi:hypothetical protein
MVTMKRRLSSLVTPYYRFTPPLLFAFGLFWLIYDFRKVSFVGALFFFILFAVLSAFSLRLKKVHLSQDALCASDYFRSIAIPLEDIARVEASSWWDWHPRTIALDLSKASGFGWRIVFIPRGWGFLASENAD